MRPITLTTPEVRELLDKGSVVVRRRIKAFPIGSQSEKLWVLERYGVTTYCGEFVPHSLRGIEDASELLLRIEYAADWGPNQEGCIWRSPATMPRWASRMTVEVVSVAVERGEAWEWVVEVKR